MGVNREGKSIAGDPIVEHLFWLLTRLRASSLSDVDLIRELASICSHVSVPGGTPIIIEGEEPDAIYIIVTEIFGAYRKTADGPEILLDRIGVGEQGIPSIHEVGPFSTWLPATTAIPGFFRPSSRSIVHVDGGVLNNPPTGFHA